MLRAMRAFVDFRLFNVHLRPGCCDGGPAWAGASGLVVRGVVEANWDVDDGGGGDDDDDDDVDIDIP